MSIPAKSTLYAAAAAILFACPAAALSADRIDWATGPALQRRLGEPVDIFWANNPLRRAIENLCETRRVAVLIDRRVDPGMELDVSLNNAPLESALRQIARPLGLDTARLGDVFYIGPAVEVGRLTSVSTEFKEAVGRLPSAARLNFHRRGPFRWDDLAEPRSLIEQLARDNGLIIERLDLLPHDLWAAADLPPLSLADRLTLIAFQYDLTLRISSDGRRLELVPLPATASDASSEASRPAARPSREKPAAGPPADLDRLRIERLTVQEKPLGPVLEQLARRLNLDLRLDRRAIAAAGVSLDRRVSVKVENATIDELFGELLRGTGLDFRRRGRIVEISPAE
ncbi:MAG: STN domain-containing protein [Pirellulales bacterium]|nr:STN domain-containing protein [Pirellulales bacterium]